MPTLLAAAPYADTAIPLHLGSVTGMRYRQLCCMECGQPLIERNGDQMFRLADDTRPSEVSGAEWVTGAPVLCGNCQQQYRVHVSIEITYNRDGIPLHMQPQSVYVTAASDKRLRYLYCLECGKAFHSISDRIAQVIDNRVPFQYLDASKLGPLEAMCHFNRCKQAWAFMV